MKTKGNAVNSFVYRTGKRIIAFTLVCLLLLCCGGMSLAEKKTPEKDETETVTDEQAVDAANDKGPETGGKQSGKKNSEESDANTQEEQQEEDKLQADERQEEKPVNYLLLVNWENPSDGKEFTLVRLDKVLDRGLVIHSNHHLIEKTAGQAANIMFRAAQEEGIGKFVIDNVYRSPGRQAAMWNKKIRANANYGANPYSNPVKVLPGGKSEHATGLALDVLAKSYRRSNAGFADTAEGKWLAHNAHKYGFILRYPANKQHITGVIYEPWHIRYVGIEPATQMYEKGLCLEEYLKLSQSKPNQIS